MVRIPAMTLLDRRAATRRRAFLPALGLLGLFGSVGLAQTTPPAPPPAPAPPRPGAPDRAGLLERVAALERQAREFDELRYRIGLAQDELVAASEAAEAFARGKTKDDFADPKVRREAELLTLAHQAAKEAYEGLTQGAARGRYVSLREKVVGGHRATLSELDRALARPDAGSPAVAPGGDLELRLARARLLAGLGRFGAARADVEAALLVAPEDPRVLGLLGMCLVDDDRMDEAAALFARACALDPTDERRAYLAIARYCTNDFAGARAARDEIADPKALPPSLRVRSAWWLTDGELERVEALWAREVRWRQAAAALEAPAGDAPPPGEAPAPGGAPPVGPDAPAPADPVVGEPAPGPDGARSEPGVGPGLPRVELVTARGRVVLELFEDTAPNAVAGLLELVGAGFYDGLAWHRVVPNYLAQTGDPTTRKAPAAPDAAPTGPPGPAAAPDAPGGRDDRGPGWRLVDDPVPEGGPRGLFRGTVALVRTEQPHSAGSQLFVLVMPAPAVDAHHLAVGRVLEGQGVVDRLEEGDRIERARVLRRRDHAYRVEKR